MLRAELDDWHDLRQCAFLRKSEGINHPASSRGIEISIPDREKGGKKHRLDPLNENRSPSPIQGSAHNRVVSQIQPNSRRESTFERTRDQSGDESGRHPSSNEVVPCLSLPAAL